MNSGRRDFFKKVGTVAAAAAAASPVLRPAESAAALGKDRLLAAYLHALVLDSTNVGLVKSFDGGDIVGEVVKEPAGIDGVVPKHIAGFHIEDIALSCGENMAPGFYQWVQAFLNRNPQSRSGAVVSCDIKGKPQTQLRFIGGRICEFVLPGVDASSKTPAAFNLRITPELTQQSEPPTTGFTLDKELKAKSWLPSNFRLTHGVIDAGTMARVNKVEAITVKQEEAPTEVGSPREEILVQPLDVGPIVLTVAEQYAQPFFDWHHEFVVQGNTEQETFFMIEYLSNSRKEVLFTAFFSGVGVVRVSRMKEDSKDVLQRRVAVEMYAERVSLHVGPMPTS